MDQSFANLDFQTFPDEVKTVHRREQVTAISGTYYVAGSAEKTRKQLVDARAAGASAILTLELIPATVAELELALQRAREIAVGMVTGSATIAIGDNYKHPKCANKLACAKCWDGDHGASHTTAHWLICALIKHIYTVKSRDSNSKLVDIVDEWAACSSSSNDMTEYGTYRYTPHEKQDFNIAATAKNGGNLEKLYNLFRTIIPGFFAGTTGMPRMGAIKAPMQGNKFSDNIWCKKPYCVRTLLSPAVADAHGNPVCNKFHSDESSFLTSLLRVLIDCRKVARPVDASDIKTPEKTKVPRAPRAPQVKAAPVAPAVAHANPFDALPIDEVADDDADLVERPNRYKTRVTDLQDKYAEFITKHADALKYNAALRARRDKLLDQIESAKCT